MPKAFGKSLRPTKHRLLSKPPSTQIGDADWRACKSEMCDTVFKRGRSSSAIRCEHASRWRSLKGGRPILDAHGSRQGVLTVGIPP